MLRISGTLARRAPLESVVLQSRNILGPSSLIAPSPHLRAPLIAKAQRRVFLASARSSKPSSSRAPLAISFVLGGGAFSAYVYAYLLDDILSLFGQRRLRRAPPPEFRRALAPTSSPSDSERRRSLLRRSARASLGNDDADAPWHKRFRRRAARALRTLVRSAYLFLTLGPAAALFPAAMLLGNGGLEGKGESKRGDTSGLPDWYLRLCLRCAEQSGAAVVKLFQWASSRPDLFGEPFCAVFERLQDHTTPHKLSHTQQALEMAYGDDWSDRISLGEVVGSGCIGQVYKGTVKSKDGQEQDVAIKVMHPNVRNGIDADLDILRFAAYLAECLPFNIGSNIKWLDLPGTVEEFACLLTLQLDFRSEAEHLKRFNSNFADDDSVLFPQLINGYDAQGDILVETYCEGMPVASFARQHATSSPELCAKLCQTGVKTICKMIFDHNFIHGDLHPGNVLICPRTNKFILLDAGMVTEYDDSDHQRIVSILTSFIRMDGRRAGELMISDARMRTEEGSTYVSGSDCVILNEEAYIDKIEALTIKAMGPDFFLEHLGTYISYICNAASTHHVMMNPAFISAALAVKVQEGIALALDPKVEVWRIANPIILQTEFRRSFRKFWDRLIAGIFNTFPGIGNG